VAVEPGPVAELAAARGALGLHGFFNLVLGAKLSRGEKQGVVSFLRAL